MGFDAKIENMAPELVKALAAGKVLTMRMTQGDVEAMRVEVSLEDKVKKPTKTDKDVV